MKQSGGAFLVEEIVYKTAGALRARGTSRQKQTGPPGTRK